MGKRVSRRVETLRRLHQFSRSAYRMTDVREVLARSAQAIAAFTNAERVFFYLYDRNTHRLEAALPAFNLTEELASELKVSVDARSIAGMVFRTGEAYYTNESRRDPYANRELGRLLGASNAVFAPLKTEDETLGVAVAINRAEGFGQEEVDAMTSFADLASLLIRNARLYTTLTGTVDELRRASRLKDHFLQNVNHELRTPLTAIVGLDGPLRGRRRRRADAPPRGPPDPAVGAGAPRPDRRPPRPRAHGPRGADARPEARVSLGGRRSARSTRSG